MGCPIIRDTLYEPMSGITLDMINSDEAEFAVDSAIQKCRVPTVPIGLQAHAVLFSGIRCKASTPWWGNKVIPSEEDEQDDAVSPELAA
mmetsp:Transcript_28168/g.65183  ORF Transcript_28168/g.65183 Transcript_28168/m.65183 type:complete len:89 (+) Transcript_28168:1240-1506(+)